MTDTLVPLKNEELRKVRPDWQWSAWATSKLIRDGKLACVRVGRRIYVTPEHLADFIARHKRPPEKSAPRAKRADISAGARP